MGYLFDINNYQMLNNEIDSSIFNRWQDYSDHDHIFILAAVNEGCDCSKP